jgi:hypothetical protein
MYFAWGDEKCIQNVGGNSSREDLGIDGEWY